MKRLCAWCKTVLGVVPSECFPEVSVTHSICEKCMNGVVAGLEYSDVSDDVITSWRDTK